MRNPTALLVIVLASTLPSLAAAQNLSGYFALGAGGELHFDADDGPFGIGGDFEADLDPSLGAGVRFDVPVASIVSVGGLFEMGGYKVDDVDREADLYFDFDVYAKIGPRIDLSGDLDVEVYGFLPFGFSIFRPDDDGIDNLVGLNLGFGGGASLYMGRFAFFAEIGLRHRRVYDEVNDIDVRISTTQAQLNFGAIVVLGDRPSSRRASPNW